MAAGREPFAHHGDDPAGYTGEGGGQFDVVGNRLEEAAGLLGLVLPGDAEEVQGIHIPEADVLQTGLHLFRNSLRVLHLGDGGDEDVMLFGLFDVIGQALPADG